MQGDSSIYSKEVPNLNGAAGFTLSYEGGDSDKNIIDFYDVSQGLIGFQRSLALTAHLVLNDEIITQAPALKGARIVAVPPEPGSWKFTAWVPARVKVVAASVTQLSGEYVECL